MDVDHVFKALADKSRRKLLDVLCENNGVTLGGLCSYLKMSRQAVMKHLAKLEEANLVVVQWNGREKLHFLNPVPLHETYGRWIEKFERHRLNALDSLKIELETKKEIIEKGKRKIK